MLGFGTSCQLFFNWNNYVNTLQSASARSKDFYVASIHMHTHLRYYILAKANENKSILEAPDEDFVFLPAASNAAS